MDMKWVYLALTVALLSAAAFLCMLTAQRAGAGIGPNGFATYARQGIISINNRVYGKGNSPWNVRCVDHPNYRLLTDLVTCKVTPKP